MLEPIVRRNAHGRAVEQLEIEDRRAAGVTYVLVADGGGSAGIKLDKTAVLKVIAQLSTTLDDEALNEAAVQILALRADRRGAAPSRLSQREA